MNRKEMLQLLSILAVLVLIISSASAENIDLDNDGSQYAYSENAGWVNFEPNLSEPNVGATVSAARLKGFIWGENIGWINLSPVYGGVFNDGAGNLSGYAWGENVGWINFNPQIQGDDAHYGVTIDREGNFSGWAWGENIGWINFNSASLYGYNVKVCVVGFKDLANFVENWLESGDGIPGDLSGGGEVDFVDYSIFANLWLGYCPDGWRLR